MHQRLLKSKPKVRAMPAVVRRVESGLPTILELQTG